jgi:hypothetical protein
MCILVLGETKIQKVLVENERGIKPQSFSKLFLLERGFSLPPLTLPFYLSV